MKSKTRYSSDSPPSQNKPHSKQNIVITVYTSDDCILCKEAIRIVKEATNQFTYFPRRFKIVEINSSKQAPKLDPVTSIPTIEVGGVRFTGIPTIEDVTLLINRGLIACSR